MKNVGIILPVYNAEKTVRTTIESILNQTYNDFELIVVNDQSTDKTANICKELCDQYDNFYFYNNTKKGVSSARNLALDKINTKYIMFIDSDDTYEPNMLKQMIKEIEENDLGICSYRRILEKELKKVDKALKDDIQIKENKDKKFLIENLQKNNLFNQIWNKIYKLEIIKANNLYFNENIDIGEDLRFNLQYIEYTQNIKYIKKVLYNYYVQENGLNYKYTDTKMKTKLYNIMLQEQLYKNQKYDLEYIYNLYLLTIFSGLSEIVKENDRSKADKILNEITSDTNILEILEKVYKNTKKKKNKIIAKMLMKSPYREKRNYAMIAGKIKKIYRRVKLNK